jgi:hypothetical protein
MSKHTALMTVASMSILLASCDTGQDTPVEELPKYRITTRRPAIAAPAGTQAETNAQAAVPAAVVRVEEEAQGGISIKPENVITHNVSLVHARGGAPDARILTWGYNDGQGTNFATFNVPVADAGTYTLYATYATREPRPMDVLVNGVIVLTNTAIEPTGGYDWEFQQRFELGTVPLRSGDNEVTFTRYGWHFSSLSAITFEAQ